MLGNLGFLQLAGARFWCRFWRFSGRKRGPKHLGGFLGKTIQRVNVETNERRGVAMQFS